MVCETCKDYDKDTECCNAHPKDLTDITCLLRNILWVLLMEDTDGENWKFGQE